MTTKNHPTHKAYAVTKNGEHTSWIEIGAAWSHKDGEGFNLKLDMLPRNDAAIVLRRPRAAATEGAP